MTAKITLPCGTVALLDIEDLPKIAGYRWYRFKLKHKNITYVRGRKPGQTSGGVLLHRLLIGGTRKSTTSRGTAWTTGARESAAA